MTHNPGRRRSRTHDDWHREYGADGREISRSAPQVGIMAPWTRPPLGPPLAGRRSVVGGRGNREYQCEAWRTWRWAMAYRAWRLRVERGADLTEIAQTLGLSLAVVGRWLRACPGDRGAHREMVASYAQALDPVGPWARLPLDDLLAALPPRPARASRTLSARTTWQERALRDMRR